MKRRSLGWKRDLPDVRDLKFSSPLLLKDIQVLPKNVDLRSSFPSPYDQGDLGSCTAQSVGAICDYRYGLTSEFSPSTLFLYYVTRSLEGTVEVDAGATIRDTIKAANEFGICHAVDYPYIIKNFATIPSDFAFKIAEEHQALVYRKVRQRLKDLKVAISSGNPVAFGFSVYDSFYDLTGNDATIKFPKLGEEMQGGHAVVAVGYDDELQLFIIRNSWGEEWGYRGHFYMPYTFITDPDFCSDFWTIELMENQ